MSVRTVFRSAADEVPTETAIRERRVEVARRNPGWTELRETDLVHRGRVLVHADSDEVFTLCRGVVFSTGSASIAFNENVPMHFFVDREGEIIFLERKSGTWSEVVAKRARRRAAT